jgi:polar amino acid transport system substrate-binding protein
MIQAVADGQFDAAGDGITITDERAEIVDFSVGYIAIEQRLLVRLDDDRFTSIEEVLANPDLKLGTQTGTTNYETALLYLPAERIQAFEQFPFAVQALIAGDIDAVIIDEVAGQGYLGENADKLKLVGPSMSSDMLGFIFPKGSELVEYVDLAIEELAQNGFLDEVNAVYFGPDFSITYDDLFPPEPIADLGGEEVTIAVENAYLPFNYIDPDTGEPAGWDYDVWDEICVLINCTPVYVEAAWEGMIQAVADGQFDAAGDGITITEARAEIVDFSVGYIAIEQRLLVRLDEDRFESIDDIVANEDFKLGTQTGTTNYETALTYLPADRIQAFEQFPFAVQALIAGDIDAVIIDEVAGQGYLGENADKLKLVGPSMSSDMLGFIFPKGSELVQYVDLAIEELAQNGFLDEVNAVYFGPDFSITYDDLFPEE